MISVDGGLGEGGGQILRTAVALGAFTGEPVRVSNIRANRPKPGLRPQHLHAVKAVARLCGADVAGLEAGSSEITFSPGGLEGGRFKVDVGTAGSTTLVVQALLFPAIHAKKPVEFEITGGTDVKWSPPFDYLKHVTLPVLRNFGVIAGVELLGRGYYPAGGGRIRLTVKPSKLESIELTERGQPEAIRGVSHASNELRRREVAERQARAARKRLFESGVDADVEIKCEYADSSSVGSGLTLWASCGDTVLGADSLGERGRRAEDVGAGAAGSLAAELASGAAVDLFMADQVVPYLGVAGGRVVASEVTGHARTNAFVAGLFGIRVGVEGSMLVGGGV